MFVLTNIGLIFLTTLFLAVSFFLIKRTTSTDYVLRLGIKKPLMELITGIIYSGLFILFQVIMQSISDDFSPQIFLIGFVLLTIILNYRIAIYSFPLALVYFLLMETISANTYAVIISFLLVSIIYLIISNFIDGAISKLILYGVTAIIGLIAFLIVGLAFDSGITANTFSTVMLPLLLLPIIETIISYAINASVEANVLYDSINFVFGRFYRDSIKDRAIAESITEAKIKQASYVLFDISFESSDDKERKEILDSVLTDIQNTVPKEVILFSNGGPEYGMFMPTNFQNKIKLSIKNNSEEERGSDDPLKEVEKYLETVSKSYKTLNSGIIEIQIFAGAAVYGIQDSSIAKLNDEAEFALKINRMNIKNRITIFDPSLYRMKVIDSYNVQSLDNAIELDNFANRFNPVLNLKTEETDYFYIHQINVSESDFIEDVKTYVRDFGLLVTFERYFAIDALKKIGNVDADIIISYSVERFNENFSVLEFLRQISFAKANPSKLIFLSDASDISEINDYSKIKDVMKQLRKEGIRFAINSFEKIDLDFDYYVVSSTLIKNTDKIPTNKIVIVPDIDTEETLQLVTDKGVKNIGGPLIQTDVNINKINKQSRIYIEEIISEMRNNE